MQTTGALSARNATIEISNDGATWSDISGFANSVEPSGGNRQTGEAYTLDGDTAIITSGKREPLEIQVNIVYTEGTTDPFETVRAAYEAGTNLYVRWAPKGGQSGEFRFTADAGPLAEFQYPVTTASEAAPIMAGFKVKTAKVTKAVVA